MNRIESNTHLRTVYTVPIVSKYFSEELIINSLEYNHNNNKVYVFFINQSNILNQRIAILTNHKNKKKKKKYPILHHV